VLSLHPAAKADTIHVVAGTDTALCAIVQPPPTPCTPTSFTADFTVTPHTFESGLGYVDLVESMTGTLNGLPATGGPGSRSWLYPLTQVGSVNSNYIPLFADIIFTSGGVQYDVGFGSENGGIGLGTPTGLVSWLTWNGTLVSTPEPSSLLLLLFGAGALLVGYALFKNKPCSV
jgi:hypothetical protein